MPQEAQQEVADFISFLHERYRRSPKQQRVQKRKLTQEEFMGIWKDRPDMQDSASWVRDKRKRELDREKSITALKRLRKRNTCGKNVDI